jgi:hypothetical protein
MKDFTDEKIDVCIMDDIGDVEMKVDVKQVPMPYKEFAIDLQKIFDEIKETPIIDGLIMNHSDIYRLSSNENFSKSLLGNLHFGCTWSRIDIYGDSELNEGEFKLVNPNEKAKEIYLYKHGCVGFVEK